MTDSRDQLLSESQLQALKASLHRGADAASTTLARWIGKPSIIEIDSLVQLSLEEATGLLGTGEEPVCFCSVEMNGVLAGELILAFEDASGLALADMLLDQPPGSGEQWTEMATSAALETTNILCCAYLNSLSQSISRVEPSAELLPSPPKFSREFAESLLEFALMGQAMVGDQVVLAQTRFEIDSTPLNWTLLFVPDGPSMSRLAGLLSADEDRQ